MITGLLHTHTLVVILFLVLYLIKLGLLFANPKGLERLTKATRVPEMIISTLFLLTGIGLMVMAPMRISTLLIIKIVLVLASIPLAVIGFRKANKALATLAVLLIIGAYGLAEVHGGKVGLSEEALPAEVITEASAPNYNLLAHGQALYTRNCAACHGEDGALKYNGAKNLQETVLDANGIQAIVKGGYNSMPAYPNYSDQELTAVAAYTAALKP